MKKSNLMHACIILSLVLASCSKEPLQYESPYKVDKSFHFSMSVDRSRLNCFGYEDVNNKTKWGPAMSIRQAQDPTKPSTTILVNNKYSTPKEMEGDLLFDFALTKKGTDPTGKYEVLQTDGNGGIHLYDRTIDKSYKISKDSLVFNVTLIGKSTLFGKYAEGNFSMNLIDVKDTAKLVPVTGSFRLHMAE